MNAARVSAANAVRAATRAAIPPRTRDRVASALALAVSAGFVVLVGFSVDAVLRVAATAMRELPWLSAATLLERLLTGAFASAGGLLVLGSLTTSVSTLFLSEGLLARVPLPIPHARLLSGQIASSIAASAAPTLLLAAPAIAVGVAHSPRPLVAGFALSTSLLSIVVLGGLLGTVLALLLVRAVPPSRARLAAAFLSAAGLSAALIGFRGARPERLLDLGAALELLESLARSQPPLPGANPVRLAAHVSTRALLGDAGGLPASLAMLSVSIVLVLVSGRLLARVHFMVWQTTREAPLSRARRVRAREARSANRTLLSAELASLLRDASTPAQLGTLAAVFVLYLLNIRFLPTADAAARDTVLGLQTALALFLVAALSLRFAYPAVSGDGRAALVLRTLPLSPARHLAARYLVRGVPSALVALVLVGVTDSVLRPGRGAVAATLAAAVLGGLSIPALNLGIGALFPRYGAANAVAVALGPGGLLALSLSTAIAIGAAPAVSPELTLFLATLLRRPVTIGGLFAMWAALVVLAGVLPLAAAARSMPRGDLSL